MLPLRPFLRQTPRIRLTPSRPRARRRWQHDNHGPHKEYFQKPSQYPSIVQSQPSQSPASAQYPSRSELTQSSALLQAQQQTTQNASNPSLIRRLIRVSTIVGCGYLLGYAVGVALITWDYLQPPPEKGTEEYEDCQEDINDILETSPMCEILRESGDWIEGDIIPVSRDGHYMTDTLNSVDGFTMKPFRSRDLTTTILLCFSGFGLDGTTDTLHTGAVFSMLKFAVEAHLEPLTTEYNLTPQNNDKGRLTGHGDFAVSSIETPELLLSGNVYPVVVMTEAWTVDQNTKPPSDKWNEDSYYLTHTASATLMQDQEILFYENPGNLDSTGAGPVFSKQKIAAAGTFVTELHVNGLVKAEGESRGHYRKRIAAEMRKIARANGARTESWSSDDSNDV